MMSRSVLSSLHTLRREHSTNDARFRHPQYATGFICRTEVTSGLRERGTGLITYSAQTARSISLEGTDSALSLEKVLKVHFWPSNSLSWYFRSRRYFRGLFLPGPVFF